MLSKSKSPLRNVNWKKTIPETDKWSQNGTTRQGEDCGEDVRGVYHRPIGRRRRTFIVVYTVPQLSKTRMVQWGCNEVILSLSQPK